MKFAEPPPPDPFTREDRDLLPVIFHRVEQGSVRDHAADALIQYSLRRNRKCEFSERHLQGREAANVGIQVIRKSKVMVIRIDNSLHLIPLGVRFESNGNAYSREHPQYRF